ESRREWLGFFLLRLLSRCVLLCPFHIKPFGSFLFGNRFLDLLQVVVCLPLALKLLADAFIVDIDRFRQIVPNGIAIIGFNDEKSFVGRKRIFSCNLLRLPEHFICPVVCKIGRINDFYTFRLWIKLADKILRYGVPIFILIENDSKRNTVVIFFL